VRDQTVINFLTTNVANPFRNLIPGTGLNGANGQPAAAAAAGIRSSPA